MDVKILKETEDSLYVEWTDGMLGFGQLVVKYDDKGGYIIDAEHLALRTVIEIIHAVAEL
jgi:hypothetical protein